jgi:hypothetical protein
MREPLSEIGPLCAAIIQQFNPETKLCERNDADVKLVQRITGYKG